MKRIFYLPFILTSLTSCRYIHEGRNGWFLGLMIVAAVVWLGLRMMESPNPLTSKGGVALSIAAVLYGVVKVIPPLLAWMYWAIMTVVKGVLSMIGIVLFFAILIGLVYSIIHFGRHAYGVFTGRK